jgi:predicted phage tail protein
MSQIITHSNILNPHDLKVVVSTARHSNEIVKDLLIDDAYEVILSKNSIIQNEPFEIAEGDVINVMFVPKGGGGGGNKVTRSLMMIVVAVASAYTGGAVGAAYGSIWGAVAAAGVSIAGGLLVNAILPVATPTSSLNASDFSSSTTYSWDDSYNKFTQSLPVPKVFGTHKITPPLISKFIETIDNKQYWNGLYALNDGLIDSVTEIKINDESISNFDNVTCEIRMGELNQPLIANFDNTKSDKEVGRKLTTSYVHTSTDGNEVISLSATLMFPRGIFYANDQGGISAYSVKVVIEYSSDGVNWTSMGGDSEVIENWWLVNSAGYKFKYDSTKTVLLGEVSSLPSNIKFAYVDNSIERFPHYWYYSYHYEGFATITANETSTFRKTFKVDNLAPAQYQIRAKFYEAPNSSSRYGSECFLEYITEELGDDFIYPSTALIAIRALATDQLSGNKPTISCVVSANSSNPALIAKQMLQESGISEDRILPSFTEWEAHCATKGYAFNGIFDTSMTLRKALDLVGTVGRASIIQFGSKFEAVMDRAEEIPVQSFTFGMGNILKDSFKQKFLPILDRANVIEVTYYDADLDYEPTIVEVSSGNYDSVAEENRTAITLIGCTSRSQAKKHARYMLNCNRYLTETVELEADKDSLVCKYGSIVRVSHDTPQYGFSGRIVACGFETVTLDREVALESEKTYYLQVRDEHNNVIEHYVNNTNDTTDTLTFTTTLETPYKKFDNYAFGEVGKASKLYRVLKIGTSGELTRKLTLLEYNEDVYNDSEVIDVPIISALGLRNLRATDYIRYAKDRSIETVMQLTWQGEALSYTVQYRKGTDAYTSVKVFTNRLDLVVSDDTYDIIVTDSFGKSLSLNYTVLGKLNPPDPVTNLTYVELQDEFKLSWPYDTPPIDFSHFEIYVNNVLFATQNEKYCLVPIAHGKQTVRVYAVDTTNNKSTFAEAILKSTSLEKIEAINVQYENNQQSLSWLKIASERSPIVYEIRRGSDWDLAQILGTTSESTFKATSNGNYMVKPSYTTKYGLKIYSEQYASVLVDGSNLPNNILESFDEHPLWVGEKTNLIVYDGKLTTASDVNFDDILDLDAVLNFDFPQNTAHLIGYYESSNVIDLGAPALCRVYVDYAVTSENMNNNFDAILDFDAIENFDGFSANDFKVEIQIATSQDGITFGDYKPFNAGDYLGQSFKLRLVLISTNKNVRPIVERFNFVIDMPDRFEQGVVATPLDVIFTKPFKIVPYTQITLSNAIEGDYIELKNETKEGFTLNVKNNGNDVVRTCNWYSSGY